MEFVNDTKQSQCQTIYVINQDKKGVDCVIASFPLTSFFVPAVKLSLDQSQEIRKYGSNRDEKLWFKIKVKIFGA